MGETEEFNTLAFEKKLTQLKDTQESIQSLSSWCLKQRQHHKKIVASWLNVLKRVKVDQRLVLFYLANDVVQYSKRKNYEFVESWGLNLQKATPLVRDEKVRQKILRIFKIWEQRAVYDEEFLSDLTGLLTAGAVKKGDDDPSDFQPQQLVNKIKQCAVLEADTDLRLKQIHENPLPLNDTEELCTSLKDRSNKDDVEKELNEGIGCVERYTQALQREIVAREALLALLTSANQYYSTQRGEVKVVAYAYKNFGARVRALKRKLDELAPSLRPRAPPELAPALRPRAPPAPSPPRDQDVPSPAPDDDIDLPATDTDIAYNIDKTFNTSLTADGSLYNLGLSSFLTTDNPMAIFHDNASQGNDSISVQSGTLPLKSQDTLPGLDLLAPPTSFYGSTIEIHDELEPSSQQYNPATAWNDNTTVNTPVNRVNSYTPVNTTAYPNNEFTPVNTSDYTPINAVNAYKPVNPAINSYTPDNAGVNAYTPVNVNTSVPVNSYTPTPMVTNAWNSSLPPAPVPPPRLQHASPPASPPPHTIKEVPAADVDHRGLLPPPPPPPMLPLLGQLEDVDHRLLAPPPPAAAPARHLNTNKDVDHRNLIPLTHQLQTESTQSQANSGKTGLDQDYRVPPPLAPTDIVESVDMDLSEDEEQHSVHENRYEGDPRRPNFNQNNKVLVGGDNGKTKLDTNLPRLNSYPGENYREKEPPMTAPVLPMSNPFDNIAIKFGNSFSSFDKPPDLDDVRSKDSYDDPSNLSPKEYDPEFGDDIETRFQDNMGQNMGQNAGHNMGQNAGNMGQNMYMNQRFPRNWGPVRTNFGQQNFDGQQFWPRNGPRPQNRPWMGPRPQQRFW